MYMCIKGPQTSPATRHALVSCCLGDGRRCASGGEVPGGGGGDVPRPPGGVVLFSVAQVSRVVMTTPTGHSPPPPQLLYSLLYLLIYYGYFYDQLGTPEGKSLPISYITDIIPHIEKGTKVCLTPPTCSGHTLLWCSPYLLRLSWSFFKHSFLKQLLTDGVCMGAAWGGGGGGKSHAAGIIDTNLCLTAHINKAQNF